jgi:hypothetical protein
LCGEDAATDKNDEYRRQWVENKLLELGAIDVCLHARVAISFSI